MSERRPSLEGASEALRQVSKALAAPHPRALEEALGPLAEAARQLREVKGSIVNEGLRGEIRKLHRELGDLAKRAEATASFYLGLNTVLLSAIGSYDSAGEVTPPSGCHSLSIEG